MYTRLYDVLGVPVTASPEMIKKAYRMLAMKWHPDRWSTKTPDERARASEMFKDISNAYSILGDPQLRKIYTRYGEESAARAQSEN